MPVSELPRPFEPMLASLADQPFDSPDHLFEIKWDGVRTLAFCDAGSTRLFSRTKREVTRQYSEFEEVHRLVQGRNAVLDGEIVALTDEGRPSFERIQRRIGLTRPGDIRRAQEKIQLDYLVFDLLYLDGEWLKDLPLADRLERLRTSVKFEERVLLSEAIPEKGTALFEASKARGLEGVVAKRATGRYYPGRRTREWLKVKVVRTASCVVGGWTRGTGSRAATFGALVVGLYDDAGDLLCVGAVGTGFKEADLRRLRDRLRDSETDECPFIHPPADIAVAGWVRPELVAEVEYREMTSYLRLRAPSFKGVREDLAPESCRLADIERP